MAVVIWDEADADITMAGAEAVTAAGDKLRRLCSTRMHFHQEIVMKRIALTVACAVTLLSTAAHRDTIESNSRRARNRHRAGSSRLR